MAHCKDKYFVIEDGITLHKTPLKCFINPILRKIQFMTDKPFVISSIVEKKQEKYTFIRYKFQRVGFNKK